LGLLMGSPIGETFVRVEQLALVTAQKSRRAIDVIIPPQADGRAGGMPCELELIERVLLLPRQRPALRGVEMEIGRVDAIQLGMQRQHLLNQLRRLLEAPHVGQLVPVFALRLVKLMPGELFEVVVVHGAIDGGGGWVRIDALQAVAVCLQCDAMLARCRETGPEACGSDALTCRRC
jgi:hypothetical protein